MRSRLLLYFLTLVLMVSAHAAPNITGAEFETPKEEGLASENDDIPTLDAQGLTVTPVEVTIERKKEVTYYYPYKQSISPRIIMAIDPETLGKETIPFGLGVSYLVPRKKQPQWEVGADVFTDSAGQITLGRRRVYFSDNYFRPYYKLSLAHTWKVEEKLASFGNWENYLFKASVGFEDVIKPPMSTRLEIELAVGTKDFLILLALGYSWGW